MKCKDCRLLAKTTRREDWLKTGQRFCYKYQVGIKQESGYASTCPYFNDILSSLLEEAKK